VLPDSLTNHDARSSPDGRIADYMYRLGKHESSVRRVKERESCVKLLVLQVKQKRG
jgi:hypothetical protein